MLETERLILRLPRLDDAEAMSEYLNDPEAMRFIGGADPNADPADVIAKWIRRWETNGVGPFAVERREDGRVLGRAGFLVWDTRDWRVSTLAEAGEHAQIELGWVLARAHWGRGYATEAARAARDWGRSERAIGLLISLIHPDNDASGRLAERLGAKPTETVTLFDSGPAVVWVHPDSELGSG